MVAVKLDECLWVRGRIESKIHYASGCVWRALLLDWGYSVEVAVQDVAALPPQFRSHGCYARRAVLAAVASVPPLSIRCAPLRITLDVLHIALHIALHSALHIPLHIALHSALHIPLHIALYIARFYLPTHHWYLPTHFLDFIDKSKHLSYLFTLTYF